MHLNITLWYYISLYGWLYNHSRPMTSYSIIIALYCTIITPYCISIANGLLIHSLWIYYTLYGIYPHTRTNSPLHINSWDLPLWMLSSLTPQSWARWGGVRHECSCNVRSLDQHARRSSHASFFWAPCTSTATNCSTTLSFVTPSTIP